MSPTTRALHDCRPPNGRCRHCQMDTIVEHLTTTLPQNMEITVRTTIGKVNWKGIPWSPARAWGATSISAPKQLKKMHHLVEICTLSRVWTPCVLVKIALVGATARSCATVHSATPAMPLFVQLPSDLYVYNGGSCFIHSHITSLLANFSSAFYVSYHNDSLTINYY